MKKMMKDAVKSYARNLTAAATVSAPKAYPEYSGEYCLTMDRCNGKSVKTVVEAMSHAKAALEGDDGKKLEDCTLGTFLALTKSASVLHMLIDLIGWMLLCDKSKVIHGDPHPGNFINDYDGEFNDDEQTYSLAAAETEAEFQKAVKDVDIQAVLLNFKVKKNHLWAIDWGCFISGATLEADGMFPAKPTPEEKLSHLRAIMCGLVRALLSDDGEKLTECTIQLGLPASAASLLKKLLVGSSKGHIAARLATSKTTDVEDAMADIEAADLNGEHAKLCNVLLFAGGLANQMAAALDNSHADPIRLSAVDIWSHWLPENGGYVK